ncbi:glycoside hydrolase family 5 protein [Marinimicrobium agarilyticum]|uniref:glycoside hydrolase family 5 protein n=1 Tax=Marinimicrobium agarilyticum TaxID=306546 RepID=UPI00041B0E31|nr:glycoside hydrolase family 5 protein [Marinimicrobium agarilyticum]
MKSLVQLTYLGLFLVLVACGGGGGNSPAPEPSTSSSSSEESSSTAESSSVSSTVSSSAFSESSSSSSSELPSYNTNPLAPNAAGMERNAAELAAEIRIGLNIGNTLEAYGAQSETYWGNPEITEAFVAFTKEAGFNAIRLPVSWDQYADPDTAEIDPDWLARVKEVVDYCIQNDLFVIVNIHWDGGWLEENVTPAKQAENNDRQRAYWEQIATHLREFDDRVIFASANEPNVDNAEQMAVLQSYHQTFVDTVRATGGKNAYRVLLVQGPNTDIEQTHELMGSLPTDTHSDRMMVEIHYYSPWNYTGMQQDEPWGNRFFYWGEGFHSTTDTEHNPTWGEEDYVDSTFALMKHQFVDNGIPVILGEYGTGVRDHLEGENLQLHLDGRAYYFQYLTQQALANGMLPFFWDTGSLLDRHNNSVLDEQALEALMKGASGSHYWQNND